MLYAVNSNVVHVRRGQANSRESRRAESINPDGWSSVQAKSGTSTRKESDVYQVCTTRHAWFNASRGLALRVAIHEKRASTGTSLPEGPGVQVRRDGRTNVRMSERASGRAREREEDGGGKVGTLRDDGNVASTGRDARYYGVRRDGPAGPSCLGDAERRFPDENVQPSRDRRMMMIAIAVMMTMIIMGTAKLT